METVIKSSHLDTLTWMYNTWLLTVKLPALSADELIMEAQPHKKELQEFIDMWELISDRIKY
jgi:hypothetical protein